MQRSQLLSSLFRNTAYDLSLNEFGHFAVASIVKKIRIERTTCGIFHRKEQIKTFSFKEKFKEMQYV